MKLLSCLSKQFAGLMLLLLAVFAGSCNDPSSQLPEAPSMSELSDVLYFIYGDKAFSEMALKPILDAIFR